jgi:hypothetical protein
MKTLFAIGMLIIFGIGAGILSVWVLNIAGIPGALLAMDYVKSNNVRKALAVIVVVLGQSYVYLAYVSFIVNWTMKASMRDDVPLGFLLWIPAFLTVFIPVWLCMVRGRAEARKIRSSMLRLRHCP